MRENGYTVGERAPHFLHSTALKAVDIVTGSKGIRRFPGGNVFVTVPVIAADILEEDGIRLTKLTAINRAVADVAGPGSLLAIEPNPTNSDKQEIRNKMITFLRKSGHAYVANIEESAALLCQQIANNKGQKDLYSAVHEVFLAGLIKSFGETVDVNMHLLQQQVLLLAREVGIKTILGNKYGEIAVKKKSGEIADRRSEINKFIYSVIERNAGLWNLEPGDIESESVMRDNLMTLLVAGTTSPAGTVCWSIYEGARDDKIRKSITHPEGRAEVTKSMAETLDRHPFGFVINRTVSESFSHVAMEFKKGDTVWFFNVPGKNKNSKTSDMFGISFGSGPRDCIGEQVTLASYTAFMKVWGSYFDKWKTNSPQTPILYTTLKPIGMDVSITLITRS